jgi:hypothetical protein
VRPTQGVDFAVGTGLGPAPHLTATLAGLAIDVDAVSAGVPTTALRVTADVAVGSKLATRYDGGLSVGLESLRSTIAVSGQTFEVLDARFGALDDEDLAVLVATAADVVLAAIGADAGTFRVPAVAGSVLNFVRVERVTTVSDDFLAIAGALGSAPPIDPQAPTPQPISTTVDEPTPAALRAALLAGSDAALPTVHVELPTVDGVRPLEHAWRTAGGAWHPYVATGDLAIRDRSFAWQGERTIQLRSRVVGDDTTTSQTGSATVAIDWAPPAVFADQVTFETHLVVPARDATGGALEWAIGRVGESEPETEWTADPNLDLAAAQALGDEVVVYVRDAAGNVGQATVPSPEPGATAASLVAGMALAFRARRSRTNLGATKKPKRPLPP